MRKILASVLATVIILTSLSVVAFAAPAAGLVYFGQNAETTFNATDDSITLPLYVMPSEEMLYEESGALVGITDVAVYWSLEGGEVDVSKGAVDFGGTIKSLNPGKTGLVIEKGTGFYTSYSAGSPILLSNVTINRIADAENATVKITTVEIYAEGYMMPDTSYSSAVTINWPSDEPTDTPIAEDFSSNVNLKEEGYYAGAEEITSGTVSYGDYSAEMGANGKVHTFFAKTATALKALEYGVKATINGNEYFFPGKADVEANQAWAIKIIIPNGTFEGGASAVITDMEKYTK